MKRKNSKYLYLAGGFLSIRNVKIGSEMPPAQIERNFFHRQTSLLGSAILRLLRKCHAHYNAAEENILRFVVRQDFAVDQGHVELRAFFNSFALI